MVWMTKTQSEGKIKREVLFQEKNIPSINIQILSWGDHCSEVLKICIYLFMWKEKYIKTHQASSPRPGYN